MAVTRKKREAGYQTYSAPIVFEQVVKLLFSLFLEDMEKIKNTQRAFTYFNENISSIKQTYEQ